MIKGKLSGFSIQPVKMPPICRLICKWVATLLCGNYLKLIQNLHSYHFNPGIAYADDIKLIMANNYSFFNAWYFFVNGNDIAR